MASVFYLPVKKVMKYEFSPAEKHFFKVEGRDPYDFARGRFLALSFGAYTMSKELKKNLAYGRKYYGIADVADSGFSYVREVISKPDGRACVLLSKRARHSNRIFEFDRFYINEKLAPVAETLLLQALKEKKNCVLVVDLYPDGASAVRNLLIDGTDIRQLAKEKSGK